MEGLSDQNMKTQSFSHTFKEMAYSSIRKMYSAVHDALIVTKGLLKAAQSIMSTFRIPQR